MFQLAKLHQKCRGCKFPNCKTNESSELNFYLSNVPQNWCRPPLPPTIQQMQFQQLDLSKKISLHHICVFYHFSAKKVVHAKEDVCAEICLGVNANLETSLKTKTCNWRKCTRWIHNIQTLPKWNLRSVCLQIPTIKIFTRVRANSSFSIILQSDFTDSA